MEEKIKETPIGKLVGYILSSHATNSEKQQIIEALKHYTNAVYDECAKILAK